MPRKPVPETCKEKGGQYAPLPKRSGVAGRLLLSRCAPLVNVNIPEPYGTARKSMRSPRRSKLYSYTGVTGELASTLCDESGTLVSVVPGSGVAALGF